MGQARLCIYARWNECVPTTHSLSSTQLAKWTWTSNITLRTLFDGVERGGRQGCHCWVIVMPMRSRMPAPSTTRHSERIPPVRIHRDMNPYNPSFLSLPIFTATITYTLKALRCLTKSLRQYPST